ncbi:NADP-dependent malic enzyme [Bacteroidetes bacterium endosymbiont of Geopemphigus sp.]|uniref:NADP-dependent malic enzyme n=1 Tax=Bacteroidetes bacterium endosymbiont of Geopemphigus sp. TaxID=2047937 RepID=UPI000CCFDE9B|nr:NADP-dependent malic enzyme [Bacteroidetes bacterium endosymbiont of Geopemphigus sp.]
MSKEDQLAQEALEYHSRFPAGKIGISPTKGYGSQRDLSLAYSPGVAAPCMEIYRDHQKVYDYTAKGNLVAVVTNGTAVLGLGDIGALASKPVMEGKGFLFKIFAGIDVFDIEISEPDPEKFIQAVKAIAPTFGGINLEDIKAPEAFEIERRLKAELNIPVMHDDQHGTAIISGAALINALELVGKKIQKVKVVVNGAGAAAISCTRIYKQLGIKAENILMCDSKGVIRTARKDLNKEKQEFAVDTLIESLAEALKGADVFIGLSVADVLSEEMLLTMSKDPIIFAMANPDPEIRYELALKARPDAILATGRSDYPNQVNNVLGFPYIFRGALDVQATTINEEMKLAAVLALADLAKAPVPEQVNIAYNQKDISFGREYIIPKPFDNRLITHVAPAVAKAAMESGVARKEITNWDSYKDHLLDRMGIDSKVLRMVQNRARTSPKSIVFCNGEEYSVIKAAQILKQEGIAHPILLGNKNRIAQLMKSYNIDEKFSVVDPEKQESREKVERYAHIFWEKKQRKGITFYDARKRMQTRDYFGAMMVDQKEADVVITGYSRSFSLSLHPILEVIGSARNSYKAAGMMILLTRRGPLFLADTAVIPNPDFEDLARIALMAAQMAKTFDVEPHVAMLSFQNFSYSSEISKKMAQAVAYLHENHPDLSVDGGVQPDFALNEALMLKKFPFSKLSGKRANVFIFPNIASGNLTYKFIRGLGDIQVIGPVMLGMRKPAHVMQMQSSIEEIVHLATFGVMDAQLR